MTFINKKDYSYLLEEDCSVVITGDSLAYNRYDFVDEPRMNAHDCPLGMESWSFLLRDFLIRSSKGWKPAVCLSISGDFEKIPYIEGLPFENEGVVLEGKGCSGIEIKGCPEYLYFITDSEKGASCTISGEQVSFKGDDGKFEGYTLVVHKCPDGKIENISMDSHIILIGGADVNISVQLTGSGSKTAEWMLENIDERIMQYKPNLCIMIIGANNRRMKNPESFRDAMEKIIDNLRTKETSLILLSPPHSFSTDPGEGKDNRYLPDESITKPILDVLKNLSLKYDLTHMDLFELFSGIKSSRWRFDNTHFTRYGNHVLFEEIRGALFERSLK